MTYEELLIYTANNPEKKCTMKNGEDMFTLFDLFSIMLFDYSFEMSHKLEEY